MSYIGNSPGVASQRVETAFTATASQTVFTPSSGYTLGYCDVYYNGVKLVNGDDYTAADGVSITLATAAAEGDSVVVVASFPRGLSDGYLKAEADAKYVALTGDQTVAGVKTFSGSATIVNGNLGVGTSSVLGNSTLNAALGIAVRNQSTSMGYFQSYNANAGSDLKTWRFGGTDAGNLVFETVNDAYSSATGRMALTASGNLGVGTTSPTNFGSTYRVIEVAAPSGSGDGFVLVRHGDGTTLGQFRTSGSGVVEVGARSNHPLTFSTNNVERARIDSSGQFGIGVAPSSAMLHVKGNWVSGHSTVKAQTTTAMSSGGVSGYGIYDSDGTRQMYISADSATLNWWGQANKPFVIAVNDAERVRIDTSGNFIIAKTSTGVATKGMSFAASGNGNAYWSSDFDNTWHVYNWSASAYRFYVSYTGTVYYTTLSQLSDEREKENIVDTDRGLAEVLSLRPVKFDWRDGTATNVSGFIAQEMQQVIPEFVDEAKHDEDGNTRLRVSTSELIPVLVKAIQEQQAIIEQLRADVQALKEAA